MMPLNRFALKDQTNWLLRTDIAKRHIQVEGFVDRPTDKVANRETSKRRDVWADRNDSSGRVDGEAAFFRQIAACGAL